MASIRALECLVAIAEHGSLTGAAKVLHLSQPALSHQIRVLEGEVGAAVVDRLARGVRLTEVGTAMLEPALTSVTAAARAVALGRAVVEGDGGVLRLSCAESLTVGLLAPVLKEWRVRHPGVAIELTERSSADLAAGDVTSGGADLAIGPRPTPVALNVHLLGRESVYVAAAADHPFAGRPEVQLEQLVGQPFIHLDRSNGLEGWIQAVTASVGVVLNPVVRVRTATSAAALASAGLGIALIPESARPLGYAGALVPLNPPSLVTSLPCTALPRSR